jgi:hypothetical protein
MLFTAETAAEMARRSHAATSARHAKKDTAPVISQPAVIVAETVNLEYARVYQDELTRLRAKLSSEDDPQRIDKLCSAIFRLEGVYCRYAGIPGPGNRKPAADKPQRQRAPMADPS